MNRGGRQAPGASSGQRAPQSSNAGYTQNAPAQDPTQGLGGQYEPDQYGAGNDGQQPPEDLHDQQGYGQANGDMSGNQEEDEDQENDAQNGGDHMAMKKKNAAAVMSKAPGKTGEKRQFTSKPQHAHSRFAQDPHHHNTMLNFHKIAGKCCPSLLISRSRIDARTDVKFSEGS
jgi:hypothetical protein